MIDDKIDNQAHVTLFHPGEQRIEVCHGAELRHDLPVVTDVIAIVRVWGIKMRAQPDHIDAQLLQIVEPGRNPGQVADPVSV